MKEPRRLVEENQLFAKLVADAQRREPPPEALNGLLERLPSGPALTAEVAGASSRRWGWTALVGAGCLALLGAGALGGWQQHDHPADARLPSSITGTPPESAPPTSPALAGSAIHAVPAVSIDDLPDSRTVASSPRTRVAPLPSAAPAKPSVRRELELIAQAREALTKGDGPACLAAVDVHDREFPAGQFVLEAKVMRIEASLATGDRDRARSLAREYLAKNPGSPYEARVRSLLSSTEDR
jgi:hypothetical protein